MVVVTGAGGAQKVLFISGKEAALSQGGLSRSVSVILQSSRTPPVSSDSDSNGSGPPLRKRQRLTHLSPEEKALRRKLKNRVAAQTARDRKKAKMGELEQQVLELELENQKLHIENRLLREKTDGLLMENEDLRQRLGLDTLESKEKVQVMQAIVDNMDLVTGSSESAALRLRAGPVVPKAEEFHMDNCSPAPADSESDVLLGILDILDPELFLKCSVPEAQDLQEFGQDMASPLPTTPSSSVGATPVKLEAVNELIHFDHIYTRPVEEVVSMDQGEVKLEDAVEMVSVKDEPEELAAIPRMNVDGLLSPISPFPGCADSSCLDAYSDSGYEQSPSPFSNMSSPLCSEASWDDVFASELFPQLISV
ncbi:X-box binding protein 1B-like [Scleropages formosus]|uniref:X-box-binding protein 1 n=1 Tax=Scleropages formosus TaxID=113540 RepID=A0A0P7U038_SCLFO|nr:X-box binding protein 1B-like [Scleropages formosus]